jgi:hypothetical protein
MNIGIIGSGEMGSCLAEKLAKLGHKVSVANTRGPESLKQLTEDTLAEAATVHDVVKDKEVIIVSIHEKNVESLPKGLFGDLPKDVVVIDTGNYYPSLRGGYIPALDETGIDSLWVQEQLGIPVVKAFNSILATSLRNKGRSKGQEGRIALAISGDDMKAKQVVFSLMDELGFDAFDVGGIAQSWKQQPGSPIYCRDISLKELKKRIDAMPESWSVMRNVIVSRRKKDELLMKENYAEYLKGLN